MMKAMNNKKNNKIVPVVIIAVVGIIAFVLFGSGSSNIEEKSKPVVDEILQEQHGLDYTCEDVTITNDNGDNTYEANASLDDGRAIKIGIEYYPKKDRIFVEIPYTELIKLY